MSWNVQPRPPLSGTRPGGARNESEAAGQVREMFRQIAPRYDFLNHFLSLEFDRLWRRRVARRFRETLARPEARVLDLCCGTGDLAMALRRAGRAQIMGSDFVHAMLVRARKKVARNAAASSIVLLEADALLLPFPERSFDLVAAAFGFRNLADYEGGLAEILRVLRPGGEVGLLEFAEPRGRLFGRVFRFYFTKVLPRLGGAVSGSLAAYSYLPSSVLAFPAPEELAALMARVGFADVRFDRWTGGIVALHRGRRP